MKGVSRYQWDWIVIAFSHPFRRMEYCQSLQKKKPAITRKLFQFFQRIHIVTYPTIRVFHLVVPNLPVVFQFYLEIFVEHHSAITHIQIRPIDLILYNQTLGKKRHAFTKVVNAFCIDLLHTKSKGSLTHLHPPFMEHDKSFSNS